MKKFRSIRKQLFILESNHKLKMSEEDKTAATRELINYGYHEIVNGYQSPFMNEDQEFIDGVTIQDLSKIFRFDVQIRTQIRLSTELFELSFKQALSYAFAEKYGVNQAECTNFEHFRTGNKNQYGSTDRDWLFKQINKVLKNKKKIKLVEHHKKEGNIPPWIVIKHLSFGDAKSFFTLLTDTSIKDKVVQTVISRNLIEEHGMPRAKQFLNDLVSLSHKYRNQASHANRIYNYFPEERNIGIKNYSSFITEAEYTNEFFEKSNYNRGLHALTKCYGFLNNQEPGILLSEAIVNLISYTFATEEGVLPSSNLPIMKHVLDSMKIPYQIENNEITGDSHIKMGEFC